VLVHSGGRAMRPAAAPRAGTFCDSAALLATDDAYRGFVLPGQFLPTSGVSHAGAVLEIEASGAKGRKRRRLGKEAAALWADEETALREGVARIRSERRGTEGRRNGTEGPNAKGAGNGGVRGGRLNEKIPRLCSVPSDGDPVASVGVSKVCTKSLVSIGYGAYIL
jgi:hypothetical protein